MDVRCEKCQTEYELDEAKLKPGGVTVKCTHCGHMFKVRRRRSTEQGPAAVADRRWPPPPPAQVQAAMPAQGEERTWLIRLDNGEITTCRELATLQKWIVAGRVSRSCEISRTGKKWKKLGEIGELSSFFDIADEAREVAAGRRPPTAERVSAVGSGPQPRLRHGSSSSGAHRAPTGGHPRTIRRATSSAPPPPPGAGQGAGGARSDDDVATNPRANPNSAPLHQDTGLPGDAPTPVPGRPASDSDEEPTLARARAPAPQRSLSEDVPTEPRLRRLSSAPPGASVPAAAKPKLEGDGEVRETAAWAAPGKVAAGADEAEPQGPRAGRVKGVPTDDVAFAEPKDRRLEIKGEFEGGRFVPTDDADLRPPKSSFARWIVLLSLLVMAGAGVVVFFVVLRDDGAAAGTERGTEEAADSGAFAAREADAAAEAAPELDLDEALADAEEAVLAGDAARLEELARELAGAPAADPAGEPEIDALSARARVEIALAQHASDEAASASGSDARDLEERARGRAETARELAEKALALDPEAAPAMVALADALRLLNEPARAIERWLRRARKAQPDDSEALLSRALLMVRDGRTREARRALERLAKDAEDDVRPRYRLALLEAGDESFDAAREHVAAVLAEQPEHAGASRLAEQIEEAGAAAAGDEDGAGEEEAESGARESASLSSPGVDSYDRLLRRADKLAEVGQCSRAKEIYQLALDENPSGVEALTGLGYCHIDADEFASAHAKFRAALGISPRYQPALWGTAEMYQQQGLNQKAIEAYRRFLDKHPNSPRAELARRQIERLGGTASEEGGGEEESGGGSAEPEEAGGDESETDQE